MLIDYVLPRTIRIVIVTITTTITNNIATYPYVKYTYLIRLRPNRSACYGQKALEDSAADSG